MLGLERYKMPLTPFEQYYDAFLQNSFVGRRYRIRLKDNTEAIGVPSASSVASPSDSNAHFNFRASDEAFYSIPFSELAAATIVHPCHVSTLESGTIGGGDFEAYLGEDQIRIAQAATGPVIVEGDLEPNSRFAPHAPHHTYRSLSIEGIDFKITGWEVPNPGRIRLKILPLFMTQGT